MDVKKEQNHEGKLISDSSYELFIQYETAHKALPVVMTMQDRWQTRWMSW